MTQNIPSIANAKDYIHKLCLTPYQEQRMMDKIEAIYRNGIQVGKHQVYSMIGELVLNNKESTLKIHIEQ
ncbi:MAG: hypothetical protein WC364_05770 [Eubacteriales bacterium]|jgi:hypothetical protein